MSSTKSWIRYLRPSRYCESDRIFPLARAEFAGLEGAQLLAAASSWVGSRVDYVPGSMA
jgi:transglutaminase-like putative cysteine protease